MVRKTTKRGWSYMTGESRHHCTATYDKRSRPQGGFRGKAHLGRPAAAALSRPRSVAASARSTPPSRGRLLYFGDPGVACCCWPGGEVNRSRPVVDSARSPQGRLLSESTCGRLRKVAPGPALIGVHLWSSGSCGAIRPSGSPAHASGAARLRVISRSTAAAVARGSRRRC